jgi:5'-3' exonuclease
MFSGTARKKCYVPIHQIHVTEDIRESLLAFHALTGCDTTSQFAGIGKKSAWTVFVKFHDLLEHLGEESIANDQVLSNAETFVCHLYNSNTDNVLNCSSTMREWRNLDEQLKAWILCHPLKIHFFSTSSVRICRHSYGRKPWNRALFFQVQKKMDGISMTAF